MNLDDHIFIAGHKGLVGQAIVRSLRNKGYTNLILKDRAQLNLLRQAEVEQFFSSEKVSHVIVAAAKVGGIMANNNAQADFLYENLVIATNIIKAAFDADVKKLLFLGSSCIYPRLSEQPIKEEYLLTGTLEPTNEGYAISKIAGLKLCEMYFRQYGKCFISAMPTNIYGPGDNFDPIQSHVIPGLMRRFHEAKMERRSHIEIWGTGKPRRDFLHVDDLADALYLIMQNYEHYQTINVGSGTEVTIFELAETMKKVTDFEGQIKFDSGKPDGTPRKILDISKLKTLGWEPSISLEEGLISTYKWACNSKIFEKTALVGTH